MKGTHTQQRRRKSETDGSRDLRSTGLPRGGGAGGVCGESTSYFPVHFRGPSALGFLGVAASLCLSWSDSKGTRASPQGRVWGHLLRLYFSPNTESSGVPGARKPWARSFLLRMSPPSMRLSADGEACSRHIWGKGEEQERSRQTRAQRRAALKIAFPLSGRNPESQELPAGTFLTGQGFLTGKGTQGAGSGGVERLLGSREGAG